jgi:hypothetical protein
VGPSLPAKKPTSLRRRIAGIIIILGVLAIGDRLFRAWKGGPSPVEIHYFLGDPPPVKELHVRILSQSGETEATFDTSLISADVKHTPRLRPGLHTVEVTLPERPKIVRTVSVSSEGTVIRIDLSTELR